MMIDIRTGAQLQEFCAEHAINAPALADALGVSATTGYKLLAGKTWRFGIPAQRQLAVDALVQRYNGADCHSSGTHGDLEPVDQPESPPLQAMKEGDQAIRNHPVPPQELVGDTPINIVVASKSNGPMTKRLALDADGKLVKDSGECWMARGTVTTTGVTLEGLATTIPQLDGNQALILTNREFAEGTKVTAAAKGKDKLTRTRDDMQYSAGPAWLLFDGDPSASYRAESAEQFRADIGRFIPGFDTAAYVATHSTSSHIYTSDGQQVTGVGGLHLYVPVKDASALTEPGALKALKDRVLVRAWLAGLGEIFIDRSGKQHVRCCLDASVWQPERLAFEAPPMLTDGLEQRRPAPSWSDGTWLEIQAMMAPLSHDEQQRYRELVAAAKGETEPAAKEQRATYIAAETQKLVDAGMQQRQAERRVQERCETGVVRGDDLLYLAEYVGRNDPPPEGLPFKVQAWRVIAAPSRFAGKCCADPVEHDYGAAPGDVCTTKARIHFDDDGEVRIWSFAHGGRSFDIRHTPATLQHHLKKLIERDPDEFRERWPEIAARARLPEDEVDRLIIWLGTTAPLRGVTRRALRNLLQAAAEVVGDIWALRPDDLPDLTGIAEGSVWPDEFVIGDDGLSHLPTGELLCGPIEVLAIARDELGGGWGPVVRWRDDDGRVHEEVLPRATLTIEGNEALRILTDGGLRVNPSFSARDDLRRALATVNVERRARLCATPGWCGDTYLWGPHPIASTDDGETRIWQGRRGTHHAYSAGTLEQWQQQIARYAVGNSRLVLAIGIALAGPLLRWHPGGKGGVHLFDASSSGKTSAAEVAGSVLGGMPKPSPNRQGWVSGWNSTAVGLEGAALRHHHSTLVLDEMGAFAGTPQQAANIVYELANGVTKGRGQADGSDRARKSFDMMILSTGEVTLSDLLSQDTRHGATAPSGGQQVRLLAIPAEPSLVRSPAKQHYGIFENLHDKDGGAALADHLREASRRYYGTALPAFVTALQGLAESDIAGHYPRLRPAPARGRQTRLGYDDGAGAVDPHAGSARVDLRRRRTRRTRRHRALAPR